MKKQKKNLIFLLFILIVVFNLSSTCSPAEEIKLLILHTNDLHGNLLPFRDKGMKIAGESLVGGIANLSSVIFQERKKYQGRTILLDAGDMFQGTPVSNIFKGVPVVEAMNYLNYDAATLGNHEFDWGMDEITKTLKLAKYRIICANVSSTQNFFLFKIVKPYVILERKGVKIAVIGLTTTSTPTITTPSNVKGIKFSDPVKVFDKYYKEVKSKGADIVVVLSHMGLDGDMSFAGKVKGANIIVGGHSHIALKDPKIINGALIVQAGCYGKYLGKLEIVFDEKTKKIKNIVSADELMPIIADNIKPDEKIAKIVEKYNKKIAPIMEKVVGVLENDLPQTSSSEPRDYPLANLICDAMKDMTSSEVSFQNSGGIRSSLYKGKIKVKDIYTLLPFDNNAVTMDLTGKQILDIMESSVLPYGHRMQVSGITVKYDSTRPNGEKIVELKINGEPVDYNCVYKVVTNSFLAEGGDDFTAFKKGKNVKYGVFIRDVFKDYFEKYSPLSYEVKGRIVDVSKEKVISE